VLAGSHVVEFTYRPLPVIAGGAVSIVALSAVTGWALKGAFSERAPGRRKK
jgi:hypothetical protein